LEEEMMNSPKGKHAWTVTVGEKGQIVIPKQARDLFNIKPGDTIILLADDKKGIAIPPKESFAELAAKIFADRTEN
jgi:AbrB family looped-hinge helix DNA binding protein